MELNLFDDVPQQVLSTWEGGECPVHPKDIVLVEHRDGTRLTAAAGGIAWNHLNVNSDVMGWCMVEKYPAATCATAPVAVSGEPSDADFLRAFASGMSYNDSALEATLKHRLNEIAMRIAAPAPDPSPFRFKMGQYVKAKGDKPGIVIGCAEFHDSEPSYLLRMDKTGNREAWVQSLLAPI